MPELPEVEYTARQLRATIIGATIRDVHVFWDRIVGHPDLVDLHLLIADRRCEGVRRRGKLLLLDLSGDLLLTIHRRMSGNLLLLPAGWQLDDTLRERDADLWSIKGPRFVGPSGTTDAEERLTRYCRMCFDLTDGRRLLFTDPRKFGRVELWPRALEEEVLAGLGPEPLGEFFTAERFAATLAVRKTVIKQALLSQEIVAGVGNIYADEALYYAAIHPTRPSNSLTESEIVRLHEGIVTVLSNGIEHGGTSFSDYRDLWGEAGDNYSHVHVYHKQGSPCERCGTVIERIVVGQRSTHYCPVCQK